jgi:phosphoglycolate phosphatase-like HAD superfamily hydrolase
MSDETTTGPDLRELLAEAFRQHHIDPDRIDRAQEADHCTCGLLVADWDEHWADVAKAAVQPEIDRRDTVIEEMNENLMATLQRERSVVECVEKAEAERDEYREAFKDAYAQRWSLFRERDRFKAAVRELAKRCEETAAEARQAGDTTRSMDWAYFQQELDKLTRDQPAESKETG